MVKDVMNIIGWAKTWKHMSQLDPTSEPEQGQRTKIELRFQFQHRGLSGIFEKIFLPILTNNQSNLSDPTLDPKCHEMLYRPLAAWFHDFKSMINHEKT